MDPLPPTSLQECHNSDVRSCPDGGRRGYPLVSSLAAVWDCN